MDGLKVEGDGSVKVYVGPAPPDGYENNWVQSNPEKGFFNEEQNSLFLKKMKKERKHSA